MLYKRSALRYAARQSSFEIIAGTDSAAVSRGIGNHRLDPMYTRFDRRVLYVTHDVTAQLKNGNNAIGVLLGNGWYNHQSTAVWYFHEAPWRARSAFCMDLRITYEDGTVETITSGKDWKTSPSPIISTASTPVNIMMRGWNESGITKASGMLK